MPTTLTPAPATVAATLELSRCDRCGAAGKTRFTLSRGGDLVFCGHHTREYAVTLAAIIIDFQAVG